jgi:hypothetical protein
MLSHMPETLLRQTVQALGLPPAIVNDLTRDDLVNTILQNADVLRAAARSGMKHAGRVKTEFELPCGKKTRIIPGACLEHILMLTPHPKAGHPIFWKIDLIIKSASNLGVISASVVASIDPLMREATGLSMARLGAHLTRKIKELSEHLPGGLRLDVVVQEVIQQVLGTLKGLPEDHNCGGDQ